MRPSPPVGSLTSPRLLLAVALAVTLALVPSSAPAAALASSHARASQTPEPLWEWPLSQFRLARPFVSPPHRYGPGHRGIDLQPVGHDRVAAPAAGTIAFAGSVAGRGILTIDHGGGLVTTLEPIESSLRAGDAVTGGQRLGVVGRGGHATPGALHFGVREHGEYINPLRLLGGVPRAVLLPCC